MMIDMMNGQLKILASRYLASEGIYYSDHATSEDWLSIVISLSWDAALFVKPDPGKGRAMDPGTYVKVKCISSGSPSESQVIKGLVFKKSAAHKHMPTEFRNAKLLLLKGCLCNSSNGLSSFVSMGQEKDHLNAVIDMIKVSHPNVVLVEKSVSRNIQEALFSKGVTVAFDMKLSGLERIALCTGSQIYPPGDIAMEANLNHCDFFHFEKIVENHNSTGKASKRPAKTLMFLEGCPRPLGCTILLKGANSDELKKIKHALHHIVFEAYHLKLEASFFADQRTFFFDTNSLKEVNGMSANEMAASVEYDVPVGCNSMDRNVSLPCAPLAFVVDIPISDESVIEPINGGQCSSNGCAEGSLSLPRSNTGSLEGIIMARNVPDNCNILQSVSNVSPSVKNTQGEYLLSPTSESILSYSGFKENEHDNDVSARISPLVKIFDFKNQLNDVVHEKSDSELHVGSNTDSFSDLTQVAEIQIVENTKELKLRIKDDIKCLLDSRSILVIASNHCLTKHAACEESHLSRINYYGNFDVSLGCYLQDILLGQKYTCLSCGEPSEAHIYKYAHHNGCVAVIVRHLPKESVLPGEQEGKIWMWTRCSKCGDYSRRVAVSSLSCGLSFGKFLDLCFANPSAASRLSRCGHLLQKDCLRFFGLGSKVAVFRYSSVEIYTACKARSLIGFCNQHGQEWTIREPKDVLVKAELLFEEVANVLQKVMPHFACSTQKQSVSLSDHVKQIDEIEDMFKQDKTAFEASLLVAVDQGVQQGENVNEILELNCLIKELHLLVYIWDLRLHFLLKHVRDFSSDVLTVDLLQLNDVVSINSFADGNGEGKITEESLVSDPVIVVESLLADGNLHTGNHEILGNELKIRSAQYEELTPTNTNLYTSDGEGSPEFSYEEHSIVPTNQDVFSAHGNPKGFVKESVLILDHVQEDDSHPISIVPLSCSEDTKESENRSKECCNSNAEPFMSQQPNTSHVDNPEQWIWAPFSELRKDYRKELRGGSLHKFQFVNFYTPVHLSRLGKLISLEHSLHFAENEISSIIACALALYKEQYGSVDVIAEKEVLREVDQAINAKSLESEGAYSLPDEPSVSLFIDQLIASDNLHPEISLDPLKIAGKSKYSVICIYAKEFSSLRKKWFHSELAYISSLSRCNKWDAQGGKSKAFFAKTMDERFIIKQIKKTELDSFVKFGPQYFKYLSFSLASGSQTCLAKILGIYQVRQARNGKEVRTDLMVMENLLFGRTITRKYDLKGASFSRYVSSDSNVPDKVLLDGNFIEDMRVSPIYVGGRSKRLLERAIWNDTCFLTSINVMDYSLLVGIDRECRELVFGIIDYVRQYTWDKQLETWVKSSLVLPKNALPTVISPKEYKKRFRKFLSKYILAVPDAWSRG